MAVQPPRTPASPSLGTSALPIAILSLSIGIGFTMMQSFGIMAETAKADLGLSDEALAAVQGVSAAIPLFLFSIPIGLWVDRANRIRIMILMASCWTIGTVVTAMSGTTLVLFAGRLLTSIGATGALTAILSLTADYCRPEQRGRGIVAANVAKTAGIAAGITLAGWLMGSLAGGSLPHLFGSNGWRSTQWWLAALSLITILPLFFLREPERREVEGGTKAPMRVLSRELGAHKGWLIPMFVGQTSVVMADAAAAIWVAPVLQREFALKPADFAGWLGAIVLVTGIVGSILGGLFADMGQRSRRRGGLLLASLIASAIAIPCALFPLMTTVPSFAWMFAALMLAGTIPAMGASAALTVWLPNELRGLAIGGFIAIAGLIAFGLAPSMVAVISRLLGGEAQLAPALAIVGVVVSIVSVGGFWLAMKRAPVEATSPKGLDLPFR